MNPEVSVGVSPKGSTTEPESFYAMRRTDGEPVDGDLLDWVSVDGPDDWSIAHEYDVDDPTEYEIVRMTVESFAKRTFPRCGATNCDEGAAYWGLCEPHAREDDPSAFDSEPVDLCVYCPHENAEHAGDGCIRCGCVAAQ